MTEGDKICPFFKKECLREKCALWVIDIPYEGCVFTRIALFLIEDTDEEEFIEIANKYLSKVGCRLEVKGKEGK